MSTPALSDRVVVTGIGMVTPLGVDREGAWDRLTRSQDANGGRAPLPDGREHRAVAFALRAAQEALLDCGLRTADWGLNWGCTVSCSKPLLSGRDNLLIQEPDTVTRELSRAFNIRGPVTNVILACATGAQSLVTAAQWVREGRCDVALAGASESSLHPLYQAGFSQLGVLSAAGRGRPFDKNRDGFVMGEGAAVFVVESFARAQRRGAHIYGEVAGWDISSDAHHAIRFNSGGERIARGLGRALTRAGVPPKDLDYLNAHGTATPLNDALEMSACRSVFGARGPKALSSTKGATGHLLGAAGAVELAFCFLALRDECLPPTLHLDVPEDPRMNFLPQRTTRATLKTAASLSFGFGGGIAAVVLKKEPAIHVH